MKSKLGKAKWMLVSGLSATVMTLGCAAMGLNLSAPEFSGTVIDVGTGAPIDGAYVMAVYREAGGTLFGHSASWCVKTKGMYTTADGKYRFPMEKGKRPLVHAIKPGHYWEVGGSEVWAWESKRGDANPNRENIYLKRQDPAKPNWQFGDSDCERPNTREDAIANVEYLKITLGELIKYGASKQGIDAVRHQIQRLESVNDASRKPEK